MDSRDCQNPDHDANGSSRNRNEEIFLISNQEENYYAVLDVRTSSRA